MVDDDQTVRAVARMILKKLGFTALCAADGREAVALFREHSGEIDAVLLDLTMPHMDGVETFAELRRIQPDVLVILASGYSEQDAIARFAGKRPAGFLQNPYDAKELMAGIQTLLRKMFDGYSENPWPSIAPIRA